MLVKYAFVVHMCSIEVQTCIDMCQSMVGWDRICWEIEKETIETEAERN